MGDDSSWFDVIFPFSPPKEVVTHSLCQPLVIPVNEMTQFGPMWILGTPFFREYYTTFSRNETPPYTEENIYVAISDDDGCVPDTSTNPASLAQSGARQTRQA